MILKAILVCAVITRVIAEECPDCPDKGFPCNKRITYKGTTNLSCSCTICANFCSIRNSLCGKGCECVMKDFPAPEGYGNGATYKSAVHQSFTRCKEVKCTVCCEKSGYFFDANGCQTCLCENPCKELACKDDEKCIISTKKPGIEPNYICEPIKKAKN